MQQTPLQKYFAQRVKNLFNHLHDFDLNGDDVSLHDFRVEMKKLRSIVQFLRQVYPKQKLKRPAHLLRLIFQEAGEMREYQLLQQWLDKHQLKTLQEQYFPPLRLEQMMMAFRLRADHYQDDFKEIIEQSGRFIASTNEILAEQYFVDLNAQLLEMTNRDLPNTEWHELRKRIKQWMYAINWIKPEEAAEKDPLFSYYNKLQEQIGQWHDLEMIRDTFAQKQIYLSQDIDIQKDFNIASEKLQHSMRYRERQIEEMLHRQVA